MKFRKFLIICLVPAMLAAGCGSSATDTSAGSENTYVLSPVQENDYIEFGTYKGKDLTWLVIAKEEDRALLLCKDYVEGLPFDEKNDDASWENCSLRTWLNGTFLASAFSDEERTAILLSDLEQPSVTFAEAYTETILAAGDEPYFYYYPDEDYAELDRKVREEEDGSIDLIATHAEESTQDYIFLLSLEEAGTYVFSDAETSALLSSSYDDYDYSYGWLRTHSASDFFEEGTMVYNHDDFYPWGWDDTDIMPVRPAMWVVCE